jgi:catecholate siderophore receptor
MAYIRSRKHAVARATSSCSLTGAAAAALVALAMPAGAQTQAPAAPAASSSTLREIKVEGAAETYKANSVASPKYTQPLVDTPQTITVIKKEVLQEQGAFTLTEALRNTPGITLQLGENGNTQSGDSISMRGFDTQGSIYLDNIRDLGTFTRDMFNIEQVEVIKGPTGADVGRAAAGGYINLSSKVPQAENFFNSSASYGSASRYRLTADLNRGIDVGAAGTSAVRLNVMKQDGGVPGRNTVENGSYGFAPSIAFGLNTPTRTYLSFLHTKQNNIPDGGVPTVGLRGYRVVEAGAVTAAQAAAGNAAPAPDSANFYGSVSDFDDVQANMFTARIEHDITSTLKLRNTLRAGSAEQYRMTTSIIGPTFTTPGNLASYTVARNRGDGDNRNSDGGQGRIQTNDILTNQTHLSAEFDTGGIKHTLGTGIEFIVERQNKQHLAGASGGTGVNGGTIPAANLYNPDPNFPLVGYNPRPNGAFDKGETKTIGVYVFDTLKLNEQWQLSAGLRADSYRTQFDALRLAGTSTAGGGGVTTTTVDTRTNLNASDTLISYKLGALYKPTANSSVYALYSVSQRPPGGDNFAYSAAANNANNPAVDPQKATNVEVGAKWDVNRNLSLTAAVFNTVNQNEFVTDQASGVTAAIGERRVRGIELGAVGQITPAWQIITGLAWLDAKITRGSISTAAGANTNGGELPFTPKLAFTSWTTYRMPFGLTVGGGARYVSSVTRDSSTNAAPSTGLTSSASYWVMDGLLSYEVNKNTSVQLNVYNLADKQYVASFNSGGGRYTPGTERSALLTANFKF